MQSKARFVKSLFASSRTRTRANFRSVVQVESLEGRKLLSHVSATHNLAHHAAPHHGQVEVRRHDHRPVHNAMHNMSGAMQRHRNDDPANHDVRDDKNRMNHSQDDPANHDANDDRGLNAGQNADDAANHDAGDDNLSAVNQPGHDDSGSHGGGKGH